ncbi:GNAT family N-acetyltransferase [Intrasporangium calvum]|uniref:GNAT family N-acetyltransferase n=1 Tax=Intrasporangium calvum TaxID=53358 RepID=A0ABT5GDW6_9MICO|nr:GNAT family N-acetyltransferase [Intrasporangium calvum]MDC5696409.1 GNAT family N-acetyltransferase [Intrasporangium calvum]
MSGSLPPRIHLHEVRPDDWEGHRDIRLEMLRDAPDAFWFTYADEAVYDEADWRERIEGAWLLHARDEQGTIGSAGLGSHWEPERATTATLFGLYVAPRARGRGVGEALVNAVLQEARRLGKTEVVLEVGSHNVGALALYERCGFVRTGGTEPHPRREDIHEIEMVHRF